MAWKKPLDDNPLPFTERECAIIELAQADFGVFLQTVFPLSFAGQIFIGADGKERPFTLGWIHYHWAEIVQTNNRSCFLAPRYHLKSTILNHAFAFWQIFKTRRSFTALQAGLIISFSESQAAKHVEQIKAYVKANPFCRYWVDNNPSAKSILEYTVSFGGPGSYIDENEYECQVYAYGIYAHLRGNHPVFLICDDILSDSTNPLESAEIAYIGTIFTQTLSQMPSEHQPLVLVGTPQSDEDILHTLKDNPAYHWGRYPTPYISGVDRNKRVAIWPEVYDLAHLRRKRAEIKDRAFQIEFRLVPAQAADSYFPRHVIRSLVDTQLRPFSLKRPYVKGPIVATYAGMDVGKQIHPSHISVGALMQTGDVVQIYQQFLDHMGYNEQALLVRALIEHFNIKRLYYDATNTTLEDRNMPRAAIGLHFSASKNRETALIMERYFYASEGEPGIIFLNDPRQTRQLSAVNKALKSVETSDGHGDAFWSNGLMLRAVADGPVFSVIGDAQQMFGGTRRTA